MPSKDKIKGFSHGKRGLRGGKRGTKTACHAKNYTRWKNSGKKNGKRERCERKTKGGGGGVLRKINGAKAKTIVTFQKGGEKEGGEKKTRPGQTVAQKKRPVNLRARKGASKKK